MKTIAIVSLKGGTGRTTIAANLARALDKVGRPTVALDLDPENALGLHFGMAPGEELGLASPSGNVWQIREVSTRTAARVAFVPFGRLSFEELRALESDVARDAHWLRRTVRALVPAGTSTVVIDTPAHGGVWLEQALSIADVVLVILRPDAASFATLPRLEDVLQTGGRTVERAFVLNGVDVRRALTRDVVYAMEQARPGELLPFTVPEDEDVREALARQRTLVDEAKSSGAVEALWQLAEWVGAALDRTSESRAAEVVPVAQPLSGQITVALGAR